MHPSPSLTPWESLANRRSSDGGFSENGDGRFRPDATAWAISALSFDQTKDDLGDKARARLAVAQSADGRVSFSPDHVDAFWPTPLAIIAWQGSSVFLQQQNKAIQFLLSTTGQHWEKSPDSPLGHDTTIRGWPWIANTHSWTEPTAMCILALKMAGVSEHLRVKEGTRLLMDRQLSRGGWNYGNSTVFDRELHPMPWSTGLALEALFGLVPRDRVAGSIDYLRSSLNDLRTPKSLGWAIRGLTAWGEPVTDAAERIEACFARQAVLGPYPTTDLCVLLTAQENASAGKALKETAHGA